MGAKFSTALHLRMASKSADWYELSVLLRELRSTSTFGEALDESRSFGDIGVLATSAWTSEPY